ncbi:MAG: DUF2914 domain-containing protein [Deltaproteobacteria bacterium]|nr:DUF2914 domain-containing protein [Deltaproteobacteria bacterium]
MKTIFAVIFAFVLALVHLGSAHAATSISAAEASLSASMNGLVPEGVGDKFKADGSKVYMYTKVVGGAAGDSIKHAWYHGDKKVLEVELGVKGSSHRTYSNKTIYPGMTG